MPSLSSLTQFFKTGIESVKNVCKLVDKYTDPIPQTSSPSIVITCKVLACVCSMYVAHQANALISGSDADRLYYVSSMLTGLFLMRKCLKPLFQPTAPLDEQPTLPDQPTHPIY